MDFVIEIDRLRPLPAIIEHFDLPSLTKGNGEPVGLLSFKIKRTDALRLDAAGGLRLGIAVGDSQSSKSISITDVGWKIDEVRLNVTAEAEGLGIRE